MVQKLKAEVYQANLDLVTRGSVVETRGQRSGVNPERGSICH